MTNGRSYQLLLLQVETPMCSQEKLFVRVFRPPDNDILEFGSRKFSFTSVLFFIPVEEKNIYSINSHIE